MNPFRGDVSLRLDGENHAVRLTLEALVSLEMRLGEDSLLSLVERVEAGTIKTRDIAHILYAGLEGAKTEMSFEDFTQKELDEGMIVATKQAALLLARAFRGGGDAS